LLEKHVKETQLDKEWDPRITTSEEAGESPDELDTEIDTQQARVASLEKAVQGGPTRDKTKDGHHRRDSEIGLKYWKQMITALPEEKKIEDQQKNGRISELTEENRLLKKQVQELLIEKASYMPEIDRVSVGGIDTGDGDSVPQHQVGVQCESPRRRRRSSKRSRAKMGGCSFLKKGYSKEYDQEIERPFTTILEAYSGPLEFLVGEDGIINSVTSAKCPLTIGDKLVKVNGSAYAGHNLKNRPLILEFCTQRTAGPRL